MIRKYLVRRLIEKLYKWDKFREMRRQRAQVLASAAVPSLSRGERLLEIGTGKGDMLNYFLEHPKVYQGSITSLDIDDQVISVNRPAQNVLIKADACSIPFPEASFSLVFMCSVLHHLPKSKQVQVIRESLRVAGRKGRVIVMEDSLDERLLGSLKLHELYVKGLDYILNLSVPGGGMMNHHSAQVWLDIFIQAGCAILTQRRLTNPIFNVLPFYHQIFILRKNT